MSQFYDWILCGTINKMIDLICLSIKHEKTVHPSTCAEVHGLLVDSIARSVTLPRDKCVKAVTLLQSLRHRRSATLHDIQSLIGTLNFSTRAVDKTIKV